MPLRIEPRRDRKLNRLIKAAEPKRLRRGETLFEVGDAARHVYLVRSGHVRLLEAGELRPRTVAVAGPWELVGEEGMRSGVRRYQCVGGEAASYQALDGGPVYQALKSTERTFAAMLEGLARDLEAARRLASGSALSASGRLAVVLLDLARRWGEPEGKGVRIPHRLTHQMLADLAGAHRSTVTTTLNDWLYRGLLKETSPAIHLTYPERLERLTVRVVDPTRRPN